MKYKPTHVIKNINIIIVSLRFTSLLLSLTFELN
nr:MAG TPA: hypothetical protein [Caudoviricetes sp.]